MPGRDIYRLIASYRWLAQELADRSSSGATSNGRVLREEMNDVFLRIVRSPADDPEVSCVQINFLVTALADEDHDADVRAMLRDTAMGHVKRLASRVRREGSTRRAGTDPALT